MRELEFLPAWYTQARRRRRVMLVHVWATLMLLLALGLWFGFTRSNYNSHRGDLEALQRQIVQTQRDLDQLDEQLELRRQLQVQEEIRADMGLHVEATRMVAQLDAIMPPEMSLLDLDLETIEQVRPPDPSRQQSRANDRRLRVRIVGVAPSDVDLANFLAKLTNVSFFQQVNLIKANDRSARGHLMREFEVTFSIDLNAGPPVSGTMASGRGS